MLVARELLLTITTPAMADKWLDSLNETCERFAIDSPFRIAGFLSNVAHESGGFATVTEGLHYSVAGLMRIWPHRFPTVEVAQAYAMQPEKIANRAYCDRMGNGSEASGDGWKFRGRGLIQLTGKNNYVAYSMACDNEALTKPEIVEQPKYAAESAGWFWDVNRLNTLADAQDVRGMCRRINGGYNGLEDRQAKYSALMNHFARTQSQ
jgi:putative chitinase